MLSTKLCYKLYLIDMYKEDLALNNQQQFVCHKTKPNQKNSLKIILNESDIIYSPTVKWIQVLQFTLVILFTLFIRLQMVK